MQTMMIIWFLVMAITILFDIFSQTLLGLWFAIAAGVALLLADNHVAIVWQIVEFVIVSVFLLLVIYPLLKEKFKTVKYEPLSTSETLVGKTGTVVKSNGELRVCINGKRWLIKNCQDVRPHDKIRVSAIDGVSVVVEKQKGAKK